MPLLPIFAVVPTLAQMEGVSNNVVGYWRFDQDELDETATGSDFVLGTGKGPDGDAWISQAVRGRYLGGQDASVDPAYDVDPVDASLRIDDDLTISMLVTFINQQWTPNASELHVVGVDSVGSESVAAPGAATNRWTISIVEDGWVRTYFSDGAAGQDVDDFSELVHVVPGVPHNLVVRRTGTTLEIYMNGVLAATTTLTAATGNGTGTILAIGRQEGTKYHAVAIAGLCIWDVALSAGGISDVYDLHLFDAPSEFSPVRAAMGASVDIDQATAQIYTKDVAGGAVAFTVSTPLLHRMTTVLITDSVGGGSISLPGSVRTINGEAPSDLNPLSNGVDYILQVYCDDETTPEYWASFRRQT